MPEYQDLIRLILGITKYRHKLAGLHQELSCKTSLIKVRFKGDESHTHMFLGDSIFPTISLFYWCEDSVQGNNCYHSHEYVRLSTDCDWFDTEEIKFKYTDTQYLTEPDAFDFLIDLQFSDQIQRETIKLHAALVRDNQVHCLDIVPKHFIRHNVDVKQLIQDINRVPFFWKSL